MASTFASFSLNDPFEAGCDDMFTDLVVRSLDETSAIGDSLYDYIPTEWVCIIFIVLFSITTRMFLPLLPPSFSPQPPILPNHSPSSILYEQSSTSAKPRSFVYGGSFLPPSSPVLQRSLAGQADYGVHTRHFR